MNVTVSQCPMGASATRRSPQALQPFRRTILVVIAVSSIKTRRVVSSQPCSRIQRRRARATSARLRSSARRLFFKRDAMASEETRQCAAACRDPSLTQDRNELIQRKVPLLADQGENLRRILLQRRRAPSTGHRLERSIFVKTLQRIAELALTSKCSAASRRDPPASTNWITRILKSPGYGPRIGQTPPDQCARLAPPANFGNPDSLRLERAVVAEPDLGHSHGVMPQSVLL